MTSTVTRIQLRNISTSTTDPRKSVELMLEAAKKSVKLTKRVQSSNLLKGLRSKRLGTDAVEKMARNLIESKERSEKVAIKLMDIALESANLKSENDKREDVKSMREANKVLPAGWRRRQFEKFIKTETNHVWEVSSKRNHKKKEKLERKHKPRKEKPSFRGIPIGDSELGVIEEDEDDIVAHGVDLNEDEKEFLKLPKSATDFVEVDIESLKTSI